VMEMSGIFLIKFGGNTLSEPDNVKRLAHEIAGLQKAGKKIVVVHGGGPAISEEMKRRGLDPVMAGGQRVTDDAALQCVEDTLRRINAMFADALAGEGAAVLGLGAFLFTISKKKPPYRFTENGEEKVVDLGLVGDVEKVDPTALMDLLDEGVLPVVYPVGTDGTRRLNVNADTMAAGIAAGLNVEEMIAVTDVPGILRDVRDPSSKIDRVTLADIDSLIADGTISGGMIPKVEACGKAVRAGASAVRMVDGRAGDSMITKAVEGANVGTLIVRK